MSFLINRLNWSRSLFHWRILLVWNLHEYWELLSIIKWDAPSRWLSSLFYSTRNSDGMTIKKTYPTLLLYDESYTNFLCKFLKNRQFWYVCVHNWHSKVVRCHWKQIVHLVFNYFFCTLQILNCSIAWFLPCLICRSHSLHLKQSWWNVLSTACKELPDAHELWFINYVTKLQK